jgi:hypothetical protein
VQTVPCHVGSYPESRAFAELLIDCEEDSTLQQAVTVGGGGQGGLSHPLEQADGSEVSLRPSIA